MDLTAIRKGLAVQARQVVGNATHYEPGLLSSFPHVFVEMPDGDMLAFGQGSWDIRLDVIAAMSDVWDRSAQERVDGLAVELWPVLEADQTLGEAVSGSVSVESFAAIRPQDNAPYIGARFTVRVVHTDA